MIREIYKFILRLHPAAFRHRFSHEMLSIFEERQAGNVAWDLLLDDYHIACTPVDRTEGLVEGAQPFEP